MSAYNYVAGMVNGDDPIAKEDTLPRSLLDALAKTLTKTEELLRRGDAEISSDAFLQTRGTVLDMFDHPDIAQWLDDMRKVNRCPFRRFGVA
jgi:hypothetical protein